MINVVGALICIAALILYGYWNRHWLPSPYRSRRCQGAKWRQAFPGATKHQIRKFLGCFIDGMGFSDRNRLKFEPDDFVLDVYRSIYGGKTPIGDNMECETFVLNLASEYQLSRDTVMSLWHEQVTLGELFGRVSGIGRRA